MKSVPKIYKLNDDLNNFNYRVLAKGFISLCELFDISVDDMMVIIKGKEVSTRECAKITDMEYEWNNIDYEVMLNAIKRAISIYDELKREWYDE